MWKILETFTDRRRKCKVECSCGYVGVRREDHVLSGRSKYCKKCASKCTAAEHGMPPPAFKGIGDLSGTFWHHIQRGAIKRSIEFNITMEYAWRVFLDQNKLCALSCVPITLSKHARDGAPCWKEITASLDRIDSEKGYVEGNVQWVHKEVNYIKRDLDQDVFVKWCKLIGGSCGA